MEDWDQETLEKAIAQKHGTEKPSNATDIICKFFLDAVEKRMYGWCGATFTNIHFRPSQGAARFPFAAKLSQPPQC